MNKFRNHDIKQYLFIVILLLFLNSCYFTITDYQNISKYKHPDFSIKGNDTLFLTNLIHPDSSIKTFADNYLDSVLLKMNKFKINDAASTMNKLNSYKIYALPFTLNDELVKFLSDKLYIRYILIWYFSKLEETEVGKNADMEMVMDIYDCQKKLKVWNCKSRLHLTSPSPPENSAYIYSLNSIQNSIKEIIDKTLAKEFQEIIK